MGKKTTWVELPKSLLPPIPTPIHCTCGDPAARLEYDNASRWVLDIQCTGCILFPEQHPPMDPRESFRVPHLVQKHCPCGKPARWGLYNGGKCVGYACSMAHGIYRPDEGYMSYIGEGPHFDPAAQIVTEGSALFDVAPSPKQFAGQGRPLPRAGGNVTTPATRRGRKPVYASNAERQRAYRERRKKHECHDAHY